MAIFVLVHGTCHGGWCWEKLIPQLEMRGHQAVAPDMPAHGADKTPARDATLASYGARVCEVMAGQPEPVILVGHSFGGVTVSAAAERCPDHVRSLVYISGLLLENGESRKSFRDRAPKGTNLSDRLDVDLDAGTMTFRPHFAKETFYNDCTDEDVAWATARLCPEPLGPQETPLSLTEANYGRLPRRYISCLRDNTVTPQQQRAMYTAMPCAEVLKMDTSHSPFLSAPSELADLLTSFV